MPVNKSTSIEKEQDYLVYRATTILAIYGIFASAMWGVVFSNPEKFFGTSWYLFNTNINISHEGVPLFLCFSYIAIMLIQFRLLYKAALTIYKPKTFPWILRGLLVMTPFFHWRLLSYFSHEPLFNYFHAVGVLIITSISYNFKKAASMSWR